MKTSTKIAAAVAGAVLLAGGFTAASALGGRGHGPMMGWMEDGGDGGWGHGGRHGGKREGRGGGWLRGLDADKDGAISLGEVEGRMLERFKPHDKNNDGAVDKAEIEAAFKEHTDRMVARMLKRFDENADGKVTGEEFTAMARKRFSWNDLDNDGKLTGDELPGHGRFGNGSGPDDDEAPLGEVPADAGTQPGTTP